MPTLMGSEAKDTIYGSTEADTIYGLSGDDYISGKSGNDLIYGDAGNDKIYGAEGDDVIYGGDGDDVSNGDDDRDIMFGGLGSDDFDGEKGNDLVFGEEGDDIVDGGHEDDIVYGGLGNDKIWGEGGNDILFGGAGNDIMASDNQVWNVINIWADWEGPQLGNDIVFGEDGDDQISGNACDDFLYGGVGDDKLKGGNGSDFLFGGDGDDNLTSEYGINRIFGENGNDFFDTRCFGVEITNDIKIDIFSGGNGTDRIRFEYNIENYDLYRDNNYAYIIQRGSKSFFVVDNSVESLSFQNKTFTLADEKYFQRSGDPLSFCQSLVEKIIHTNVRFSTQMPTSEIEKAEIYSFVETYSSERFNNPDVTLKNYWTEKSILGTTLLGNKKFVEECGQVNFDLSLPSDFVGTTIPFTVYGISEEDILGGTLSGVVNLNAEKKATISLNLLNDRTTEGREILKITANGVVGTVIIDDTSRGNDFFLGGTTFNDSFRLQYGSEKIDGGVGSDIVQYQTTRSAASITLNNGTITVSKAGGTDTITGVERIDFTDGDLVFDMTSANAPAAYRLYGGAFARTPDEGGFRFWASTLDKNVSLRDVATQFINSDEFIGRYGASLGNAAFVDALYQNVLGRGGDAGGVAHWNRMLDNKFQDRSDVLVEFTQLPEFVGISAANITHGYWVV